jgi:tetratricopeptide (TPR) repeat protein
VLTVAAQQGFAASAPLLPDLSGAVQLKGAPEAGGIPLLLHVGIADSDPRSFVLLLGVAPGAEPWPGEEQLATQPISGTPVAGAVWMAVDAVWLLSGSIADGEPLRRAVGLRRGSLRRGEAQLHNAHGLALRRAGDLPGAEREFERAAAADARFFDALYNAASVAAGSGRDEAAMALLRRAARVDRRRLEVLGRDDESLARLRSRPDLRELLGMKRPPPDASK